jgi:hypothetical protein
MAFARISVALDSANPTAVGFGIPMLPSPNADAAFLGDRARKYRSLGAVAADFPSKTGPEYLWAAAAFAQNPRPEAVIIGRLANKPTMVYELSALVVTPGATYNLEVAGDGVTSTDLAVTLPATNLTIVPTHAADLFTVAAHGMVDGAGPWRVKTSAADLPLNLTVDTDYWITAATENTFKLASSYANAIAGTPVAFDDDGTGVHTLDRTSNDVLMAQLKQALNNVVGKNYTAAQVAGVGDTDTLTVTGSAAGEWFSLAVDPRQLVSAQVYADPGVADDLDAIQVASKEWYCVHNVYASKAIVMAIAAWVEANVGDEDNPTPHYYEAETSNTLCVTGGAGTGGNHIGDSLKALGYERTHCHYSRRPVRMFAARSTGRVYSLKPGEADFVYKQLAGIEYDTSLTDTHKANLLATRMSFLNLEKGLTVTAGGKMASGQWWDVTRSLDYVRDQLAVELLKVRVNNEILPMTDGGIASCESAMRIVVMANTIVPGQRERAVFADTPPPSFVIPRAVDISTANRQARRAGPLLCTARHAGSINDLEVELAVTF